ncbi:MAG TPA: hypothetical protein VL966_05755 [Alphaproteobacteria bacterium]|jgi:hypothetical protein|nr:hypothetical protein [Alphaproteobacteria bacterium]
MRALVQRIGAWTDRHAFACRVAGLAAVVAFTAVLSISEERQRARFESVFTHSMRELFRKANFWRIDETFLRNREEAMRDIRARMAEDNE